MARAKQGLWRPTAKPELNAALLNAVHLNMEIELFGGVTSASGSYALPPQCVAKSDHIFMQMCIV